MSKVKTRRKTTPSKPLFLASLVLATFVASVCLSSCNVTRTVTTSSQYMQKGDTSIIIQTKTIESYDGQKK